jgi:hypothetical protein
VFSSSTGSIGDQDALHDTRFNLVNANERLRTMLTNEKDCRNPKGILWETVSVAIWMLSWCAAHQAVTGMKGQNFLTFLIVNNCALVILFHLRSIDASIEDITSNFRVPFAMIRNHLQKRRASCTWTTQDKADFARFQNARRSAL